MTPKENFYAMINGGEPEYAPCFTVDFNASVLITNNADQPWQGGVDPFGVTWSMTHEGPIPKPGDFMFTEISDWEKYVKFPDIDSLGLEQMAAIERQNMDPNKPTVMMSVCGIFERMAAFMGFENTLIALAEDPEECMRFAEAFANYKIAVIERGIDLVHPDMVALFDDVATARGLFMSPECWRRVIKPFDKKIADAVRAKGIIFCMHTCGKCEDIVDDYVEIGAQWWNSAQPMNDLKKIMEKHAGRLVVDGGWDSEGPASYPDAAPEVIAEEAKRCLREYACYKNFSLFPIVISATGSPMEFSPQLGIILDTWGKGKYHDQSKNSLAL